MHYLQLDMARCDAYISYIEENGTDESSAYDHAEKALLAAFSCGEGK
jgi:hypothetical protein